MFETLIENKYKIIGYKEKGICPKENPYISRITNWEPQLYFYQNPYPIEKKIAFLFLNDFPVELPIELVELAIAIKKAQSIIKLEADWDGENSKAYSKLTLIQAVKFLAKHAKEIHDEFSFQIRTPKIFPGPDGSIDLLWKNNDSNLLINIPEYPNKVATFYGKDNKAHSIEGSFDITQNNLGILLFLKEISISEYVGN